MVCAAQIFMQIRSEKAKGRELSFG